MTVLEAPQEPPTWTHKPEDVLDLTKTKISHVKAILDQVAALREHECNFDSVFRKLAEAEASLFDLEPLLFYRYVSPDEELRDASSEAAGLVCYFNVEADMRLDVFIAKKQAEANFKSQNKKLSGEEQRLVDKMILQGHRAGLDLPENERTKLTELKKEVLHLCGEFRVCFIALLLRDTVLFQSPEQHPRRIGEPICTLWIMFCLICLRAKSTLLKKN